MNFLTSLFRNFLSSDDDQARRAEESYLAESSDLWELEYRQRELDRHSHYWSHDSLHPTLISPMYAFFAKGKH